MTLRLLAEAELEAQQAAASFSMPWQTVLRRLKNCRACLAGFQRLQQTVRFVVVFCNDFPTASSMKCAWTRSLCWQSYMLADGLTTGVAARMTHESAGRSEDAQLMPMAHLVETGRCG